MPTGWKGPSYPRTSVFTLPLFPVSWASVSGDYEIMRCKLPDTAPWRNGALSPLFLDPCWPVTASTGRMPSKWRHACAGPRLERLDSFYLQPLRTLGLESPSHCVRSLVTLPEMHGEALRWHGEEEGSSCPHQSIQHVAEAVQNL